MGFLVSPGVDVNEIDLTNVIPAVSTSIGGYAGPFRWGPVDQIVTVSSEKDLVSVYGKPDAAYAESFFTAASFLKYGNSLKVSRAWKAGMTNAVGYLTGATVPTAVLFKASEEDPLTVSNAQFIARHPGILGNSLAVSIVSQNTIPAGSIAVPGIISNTVITPNATYTPGTDGASTTPSIGTNGYTTTSVITWSATTVPSTTVITHNYVVSGATPISISSTVTVTTSAPNATATGTISNTQVKVVTTTSYYTVSPGSTISIFPYKPTIATEFHLAVIDTTGVFTGTAGSVLETYTGLSTAVGTKREDSSSCYYVDVINLSSAYIRAIASTTLTLSTTAIASQTYTFAGGIELVASELASDATVSAIQLFADAELVDVNLIFAYGTGATKSTPETELQTIAASRKDCVAFISAPITISTKSSESDKLLLITTKFFTSSSALTRNSYSVFDSSPLYVYNKYLDNYLWIPACGHMAGLCANTDDVAEPWFSPAGYTRGQLFGVTKLGFNPNQSSRDTIYKMGVNPICAFPGQGIILFGDKTAQAKPSAFDRINVRRLFIVLEKAIATASKYQLFELNDEFTRAMFRNMVEPFLRDVKGRRGITDFLVVCDETNNTGEVIDGNRFVADIYIKPARSINFITLNFIATRTGVEFSEIVGK